VFPDGEKALRFFFPAAKLRKFGFPEYFFYRDFILKKMRCWFSVQSPTFVSLKPEGRFYGMTLHTHSLREEILSRHLTGEHIQFNFNLKGSQRLCHKSVCKVLCQIIACERR
jgi:hypothetical protein